MASSPTTSRQTDGETMATVRDFIFLGSKIPADGDCSHEIEKTLASWKKSYDQPRQHFRKQRHYFADKGPPSQSYGFSSSHVWMWELDHKESWVPKNWCFWTVVLEKTLERVPWTARRSNQFILKEISPEYSLEELMLKLKLQCFGHLMQRNDSSEKTLMLGKIEGMRRGWQRMRWLDGITDLMDMSLSKLPGVLQSMELQSQTRLSDWTELIRENAKNVY